MLSFGSSSSAVSDSPQHIDNAQPSRLPCHRKPRAMKVFVVFCLFAAYAQTTLAFVGIPFGHRCRRPYPGAATATTLQLRSVRSLRVEALRMAEGGGDTSAAEETAKRLKEQAAALRESAAASEAEIRPIKTKAAEPEEKLAAGAPEDMIPSRKISDGMRQRLKNELESQGANPNKSAGNPILIVAAVIGLLVIVGGQGIFY